MTHATDPKNLSLELLDQDRSLSEHDYAQYREKLTRRIEAARRTERIAFWVCAVSAVLSFSLMFVGGSGVIGAFDPWSKDATPLSITVAAIYIVSTILF